MGRSSASYFSYSWCLHLKFSKFSCKDCYYFICLTKISPSYNNPFRFIGFHNYLGRDNLSSLSVASLNLSICLPLFEIVYSKLSVPDCFCTRRGSGEPFSSLKGSL